MSRPGDAGGQAVAARRGDLAVVQQHHTGAGQRRGRYDTFTVGQVTGITREGVVRVIRPAGMLAGETDGQGRERPGTNVQRAGDVTAVHVISSRKIDVEGALATAACHVWHGGEIPRPYDSLTEAGDELRPHLRSGRLGVWDRLRTAARFRDAEAREAHAALLADGSYDAYQAALGVANGKYRQVYEEATGRQAAAGAGSRARDPEAEAGPG